MIINGLPVFLIMPDFAERPQMTGIFTKDSADISFAPRIEANVWQRPVHALTHNFLFSTRELAAEFEDFIDSVCGSWKQFYVPSWHLELEPTVAVNSGDITLTISPVDYAKVYNPNPSNLTSLGNYIFILSYTGALFITQINAVETVGSNEVLTMATPAPTNFPLGQFVVGFVYCVTGEADDLVLSFSGINNVKATLKMTEAMQIGAGNGN